MKIKRKESKLEGLLPNGPFKDFILGNFISLSQEETTQKKLKERLGK